MPAADPAPEAPRQAGAGPARTLRHAVADAVLAPVFICRSRRCRRHRCCSLSTAEGHPLCIVTGPVGVQEDDAVLLSMVTQMSELVAPGVLQRWNGQLEDGDIGDEQRLCLEIIAARLPPGDPLLAEFQAFWRRERNCRRRAKRRREGRKTLSAQPECPPQGGENPE